MDLSRLVKRWRAPVDYHIEYLTPDGVGGWAIAPAEHVVRVQAWSGTRCLSETIAADERPDVAAVYPRAPNSLRSGFNLAFAFPAEARPAEIRVRLMIEDRDGSVVAMIDG